jgi:hypothetical protein
MMATRHAMRPAAWAVASSRIVFLAIHIDKSAAFAMMRYWNSKSVVVPTHVTDNSRAGVCASARCDRPSEQVRNRIPEIAYRPSARVGGKLWRTRAPSRGRREGRQSQYKVSCIGVSANPLREVVVVTANPVFGMNPCDAPSAGTKALAKCPVL